MPDKMSHGDLVAKIAMNSKLTAAEVEEALEVLSAIVQDVLQGGGSVDLRGVGTLSITAQDKSVSFAVGQSLKDIVADPGISVQIERRPGLLSGKVFDFASPEYVHKVNVC